MQYGFHFFVLIKYSNFCPSSVLVTEPFSIKRITLRRNCFIIVHIASDLTGPPVRRLQTSLASGSYLKGCSLSQSRTYGNEQVSRTGPLPVLAWYGISPSP